MSNGHRHVVSRTKIALLVALLVVPLLFSRHDHATREAQGRPCAACILAHHLPVVSAATLSATPVAVRDHVVAPARRVPVARPHRSPDAGRAPPSGLLAREA